MKYFCFVNIKFDASREETIKLTYPRIKFVNSLEELENTVKPFDVVVFDNILELDPNDKNELKTIYQNYKWLHDKHVDIMFDRSPNCDSSIIHTYIEIFKSRNVDISKDLLFELILEMQIVAYINIRDASANIKKYSQLSSSKLKGTSYGRPKGSTRDSEKAVKAKEVILKMSKDFNGNLSDEECIPFTGASRNMFYRYKKQLKADKRREYVKV